MERKSRVFKKAVVVLIVLIFTVMLCLPVNAASSAVFSLSSDYNKLSVGQAFNVVISIDKINDPVGIILVDSSLYYDDTCFEIVKWKNNFPKSWSSDYEDFSVKLKKDEQAYFYSSFFTSGVGKGVTQDGVLSVVVTFKVLSEDANGKQLVLKDSSFSNENLESFIGNTASMTVKFEGGSETSVGSVPESSPSTETVTSEDGSQSTGSSESGSEKSELPTLKVESDIKIEPTNYAIWIIVSVVVALAVFSLAAAYLAEKKKRRASARRRRR